MQDQDSRIRTQTVCLMILSTATIAYAVYWLRPVLVPFVVAVFVVSGIGPILDSLERRLGVSRLIAAVIAFLAGLALMTALSMSLWASTAELADNAPAYRQRVQEIVDHVEELLPLSADSKDPAGTATTAVDREGKEIGDFLDSLVRKGIAELSAALVELVSTSLIVLIYVFFMLLGGPSRGTATSTWREIDSQMRSYLSLKTIISIITGALFGLALSLFGIPMAMTFGVLAFLLNFIPNIGPLLASLLPIPLIILQPDASIGWMIAAVAVSSGVQFVSGNVVEPKIMSDSSDLHPIVVLLALMFWGMMWGIVGMFLATPITASLKIVLERIEATRPIGQLLAGKWPTSAEQAVVAATAD